MVWSVIKRLYNANERARNAINTCFNPVSAPRRGFMAARFETNTILKLHIAVFLYIYVLFTVWLYEEEEEEEEKEEEKIVRIIVPLNAFFFCLKI